MSQRVKAIFGLCYHPDYEANGVDAPVGARDPGLAAGADARAWLVRARQLYNQRHFAEAIAAADRARLTPGLADAADLVAARAYLERYRASAADDDLEAARERLRRVDPLRFTPGERAEFIVGLGETLYFEDAFGAAAEMLGPALAGGVDLAPEARERVLDWWASALDREARARPDAERGAVYARIRDRMREEVASHPGERVGGVLAGGRVARRRRSGRRVVGGGSRVGAGHARERPRRRAPGRPRSVRPDGPRPGARQGAQRRARHHARRLGALQDRVDQVAPLHVTSASRPSSSPRSRRRR